MADYSYTRGFTSAEEAQPVLNEAASRIGGMLFDVNMGTEVVGDDLMFVDTTETPPSKVMLAANLTSLESGMWHDEFGVRALGAALAIFVKATHHEPLGPAPIEPEESEEPEPEPEEPEGGEDGGTENGPGEDADRSEGKST